MANRKALSICFVIGAILLASNLLPSTFVPPARRSAGSAAMLGVATAASVGAAPAFADEIGEAAKKFASASYPFLKEVNWNSGLFLANPGKASAGEWAKAIATAIDMGAAMDPALLKQGVKAHHQAIGGMDSKLVTTSGAYQEILASIGRMVASVPEAKTMATYEAFGKLVDPAVPKYLMGTVNEADAAAAYNAFMEFKDVVKAHPITAKIPVGAVNGAIDKAASKAADASYPFVSEVDWNSNLFTTQNGFTSTPLQMTKAIDKALVMGYSMDSGALRDAALAHVKAINGVDAKGVATKADYTAAVAGIAKMIASAGRIETMEVYNAFSKTINPQVPGYLMSTVQAADAKAAYKGLIELAQTVASAARY